VTGAAGGRQRSQGGQGRPARGRGQWGGTGRWAGGGGLVIVDKPQGLTSHDVVARIRRLAGTRRVGHAGTLDPMATGVLVIGVEKATRLLGHLALAEKEYSATIRLGQATDTDDAEGQVIAETSAAGVSPEALRAAVATLTGEIEQVPPGYSAIKVAGKRAYKLAREGAAPELAARTVTVTDFRVLAVRRDGDLMDADVTVTCSSGTYIRALARDVGRALGVGGHLTALRRTRVGPYEIATAATLDQLSASFTVTPLAEAARVAFRPMQLTEDQARAVAHGVRVAIEDLDWPGGTPDRAGPVAAFAPDGSLIALLTDEAGRARPLAVFAG
jgi:tRNA pseudouridine55 synthase